MACLDENQLLELSEGTLAGDALAAVELHLDGCEACRRLVAEVMRADPAPSAFPRVEPGHYVGTRELARGGMGRIRLARDQRLERDVAIKEMLPGRGDRRRFEREARLTARLQHPSIVKVLEAGVWPSGQPFYAMPHVKGRSLETVLDEASTLELRLALLPHVLAVADAMASAHAEFIIHRDLKPANVLVGRFGETVVIDWGLAKDLGAPVEADPITAPARLHRDMTADGTVVGTPAYMAPEQALGGQVDARTDVYALGAMLDHLLSGARAWEGDGASTVEQVKRGPPRSLRERAPRAPLELVAIAQRAMARSPDARYPSAAEFASDLRRYQTGQLVGAHEYSPGQLVRRWLGRHRAAVAVATVAVLVLLVIAGVAVARVVGAQQAAEHSRANAENLLDFIEGDLHTKLGELGRLDLMEDAARRAVERSSTAVTPAERSRLALARQHLGEVLDAQGKLEQALEELRAAVTLASALTAQEPGTTQWPLREAASRDALGKALQARGEMKEAESEYRHALALREATAPTDEVRAARASSHERLSLLLVMTGRPQAALDEAQLAVALRDLKRADVSAEDAVALSSAKGLEADALLELGRTDEGVALYRAAVALSQPAATAAPDNVKLARTVAMQHERLGDLLFARAELAAAGVEYERSLALDQTLVTRDGANLTWLHDLAYAHDGVGDVLLGQGKAEEALAHYGSSAELRARVCALDPSNAWVRRDRSISHDKLGETLLRLGRPAQALAEFQGSLALREALLAIDPTNDEWVGDVVVGHDEVGSALLALGSLTEARAHFLEQLRRCEGLSERHPGEAERAVDLAESHLNLGDVELAQGDAAKALAQFDQALALLPQGEAAAQTELATQAHEKRGLALRATGAKREAEVELAEALRLAQQFAESRPEDLVAQRRVHTLSDRVRARP